MNDPYFWLRVLENIKRENYHYHCGKKACPIHDVCVAQEYKNIPAIDDTIRTVIHMMEEEFLKTL